MSQYSLFISCLKTKPMRNLINGLKKRGMSVGLPMFKEWIEKDYIVNSPTYNFLGKNCIDKLTSFLKKRSEIKKVLIVTTDGMVKQELYIKTIQAISNANVAFETYGSLKANPSIKAINEIVWKYKDKKCDCLIALGGGSAHDAVKGAGLILVNNKTLKKYQGINFTKHKSVLRIHINTTAGTGAETTNVIVVSDTEKHRKFVVADKYLMPDVTFNDPELMLGLPASTTAWTGVDALVHAIESYLSNDYDVQAKVYALEAMHLIFDNLPTACTQPTNVNARDNMCYAQFLAGQAFNITSLGFIHSLSHPLTALFNTPHGLANAMLLPNVLEYELKYDKVVELLDRIAWSFKIKGSDPKQNARVLIAKIRNLLKEVNIPDHLEIKDHAVLTDEELNILTKQAMIDFCGISNPVQFSRKQLKTIYQFAFKGGSK